MKYVLADSELADRRREGRGGSGTRAWRCTASTASLRTSTLDRTAGTATRGRSRSFDWTRRECTAGSLRVQVHSDSQLFAGVTQHIAVSGSTTPFTVGCRRPRRRRSSCTSCRAAASVACDFAVTPCTQAAERPAHARRPRLRLRVRPGRGVRIVVDVAPLSHPRTRRRQLHPRLAARARRGRRRTRSSRSRPRAGAASARSSARSRASRSSARCRSCRRRMRCAPPGAASAGPSSSASSASSTSSTSATGGIRRSGTACARR